MSGDPVQSLISLVERHKVLREIRAVPRGGGLDIGPRGRPFARLEPTEEEGMALLTSTDGRTTALVRDLDVLVDWLNTIAVRARHQPERKTGK